MRSSIRMMLFVGFAALMLLVLVIVYGQQYQEISAMVEANQLDITKRYLENVNDQLVVDLSEMDVMSEKVIYSLLTSNMIDWKANDFSQANVMLKRKTSEMLYYISDLKHLYRYVVKLYNSEGKFIYLGSDYAIGKLAGSPAEELFWANPAMALDGAAYVTEPYMDETTGGQRKVSLCRAVKNLYTVDNTVVYIDVQITEDRLFESMNENVPDILGKEYGLIILNRDGRILYDNGRVNNAFDTLIESPEGKESPYTLEVGGERYVTVMNKMKKYDWYTFVMIPEADWTQPLRQIARSNMGITGALFVILLLAVYITTLIMTRSLVHLTNELTNLNIDEIGRQEYLLSTRSRVREVSSLVVVFNSLLRKIYAAVNEMYEARIQETQAQLRALQLMVDPHFLFNSLGVIRILAKREKNEKTEKAAECLAAMMYYLSNQQEKTVTIRDEMKHAENYLHLMRLRMSGNVVMESEIPEDMMDLTIPKMVIQPIVENCFKYKSCEGEVRISIRGRKSANLWYLEVRDNGIGFSEESIKRLHGMMHDFEKQAKVQDAKIGGYSLVNIYSRIRLAYGRDAMIDFGNLDEGGAFVRIGGRSNE